MKEEEYYLALYEGDGAKVCHPWTISILGRGLMNSVAVPGCQDHVRGSVARCDQSRDG